MMMNTNALAGVVMTGTTSTAFQQAVKLAKTPILISLLVTPVRFGLELAGLSENIIFIIGLLWLTLGFSIYWGVKLVRFRNPYLVLLLSLLIFSPISRVPVFILWWADRFWSIGTHYGDYYTDWDWALLNHVGGGTLVQVIPGFILGSVILAITQYKQTSKS